VVSSEVAFSSCGCGQLRVEERQLGDPRALPGDKSASSQSARRCGRGRYIAPEDRPCAVTRGFSGAGANVRTRTRVLRGSGRPRDVSVENDQQANSRTSPTTDTGSF
jgi:hypothetical protein